MMTFPHSSVINVTGNILLGQRDITPPTIYVTFGGQCQPV